MEILHKLGIDWKLLLAQGVNFLILLYILKRFVYKPMLAFLDERGAKIEAGLKSAEAATQKLAEAEAEHKAVLQAAQQQAKGIIEEAVVAAKQRDQRELEKTKSEIAKMLDDATKRTEAEKASLLREAKAELAALVLTATEKVAGVKLTTEEDQKQIASALEATK
jgi:F-type H+-transporting ATPase subunit b